jgi:HSP20 family protein
MTLVKYAPSHFRKNTFGFNSLFDELFDNNVSKAVGSDTTFNTPAVNIVETEKGYTIDLAAPGYSEADLNVRLEDNLLTIESERKESTEKTEGKVNRSEFHYGSFKRSFKMPREVDSENIVAKYTNGILSVNVPKTEKEQNKTREIKIS